MPNKYDLVLCELHYNHYHGKTSNSYPFIDGHYLLIQKINNIYNYSETRIEYLCNIDDEDDEDDDPNDELNLIIMENRSVYENLEYFVELTYILRGLQISTDNNFFMSHTIIRNYLNIIENPYYIKPEIAQCITLDSGETIVILKTIWLRIIQRKWKKIYNERKQIQNIRKKLNSLRERELTGKWPKGSRYLPSIYN